MGERNLRQFWNNKSVIYVKCHVQIVLLFVCITTHKAFVIFTRRYFKLSWNTTALSQSNCRNFSSSSIMGSISRQERKDPGHKRWHSRLKWTNVSWIPEYVLPNSHFNFSSSKDIIRRPSYLFSLGQYLTLTASNVLAQFQLYLSPGANNVCIIFVHLSFSLSLYSCPPVDMLHVKFVVRLKIFNLPVHWFLISFVY